MKSSEIDIAVLRTDEVLPQFVGAHGDYPDMFKALLERAARADACAGDAVDLGGVAAGEKFEHQRQGREYLVAAGGAGADGSGVAIGGA